MHQLVEMAKPGCPAWNRAGQLPGMTGSLIRPPAAQARPRRLDSLDLSLDWTETRAADIASRARAFLSLMEGGMALDQAVAVSGVLTDSVDGAELGL